MDLRRDVWLLVCHWNVVLVVVVQQRDDNTAEPFIKRATIIYRSTYESMGVQKKDWMDLF